MSRILIIQHEENCGPARLGEWLAGAGAELVVVHGPHGPIPADLAGFDGLVVLGGSMNCDSDADHPWLTATKARIREAVAVDIPFLGVCLGLQLAASALGGRVGPNDALTLGLRLQLRTPEGMADPLLSIPAEPLMATHYNGDHVITAPPGAVVLAHAPDGHISALRLAPRAWGVQFHLEVDGAGFAAWTLDKPEGNRPRTRAPLADVVRVVADADDHVERIWRPVAEAFVATIG